jgi:hypothetical protein
VVEQLSRREEVSMAAAATVPKLWCPVGASLLRAGVLSAEQLEIALIERERSGRPIRDLVLEWGWASSDAIAHALTTSR